MRRCSAIFSGGETSGEAKLQLGVNRGEYHHMSIPPRKPLNPINPSTHVSHKAHEGAVTELVTVETRAHMQVTAPYRLDAVDVGDARHVQY